MRQCWRRMTLMLLVLMGGATTAGAVNRDGLSAGFYQCREQARSMLDEAVCLSDERQHQDARLAQAYQALLSRLQGRQREMMLSAQQAWLQSSAMDSEFEVALHDASQAGNLQNGLNELLRHSARVEFLQGYLDVLEPMQPAQQPQATAVLPPWQRGMAYTTLRGQLMASGWQPRSDAQCQVNVVGDNFARLCANDPTACQACEQLPELSACSGTGQCTMYFRSGEGQVITVSTYGDVHRMLPSDEHDDLLVTLVTQGDD
jgi:uncharacterized protein YecT (DUF1311 family)